MVDKYLNLLEKCFTKEIKHQIYILANKLLVGFDGGKGKKLTDDCIVIDSNIYGIVEDCHTIILHSCIEIIKLKSKKIILA